MRPSAINIQCLVRYLHTSAPFHKRVHIHIYALPFIVGELFLAPNLHSNYTPTPLPTLVTGQMLQVSVGQYLFDTAGTPRRALKSLTYVTVTMQPLIDRLEFPRVRVCVCGVCVCVCVGGVCVCVCVCVCVVIGWTYYKSGLLTYLITNEDLPTWLPFKLNTATFSFLLPILYKLYPSTRARVCARCVISDSLNLTTCIRRPCWSQTGT